MNYIPILEIAHAYLLLIMIRLKDLRGDLCNFLNMEKCIFCRKAKYGPR